jgi:crotonobetainyl-CoA:carnitine CoA-transferase CaiB-like acyl-CoA transferase
MTSAPPPLDGLLVVDLTRVLSGPYCTMLLADMGARVIKIEQPGRGDDTRAWGPPFMGGESAYFVSINRNKESLTLDLKHPEGRAILDRLLDRADVLVENFRPGAMDRLGLGKETIASRWPSLVACSISGFGQNGPRRDEPGYDAVVQAEAGLMSITGEEDGPALRLGLAIADVVSGMFAAQGIAMALLARTRTGRGQHIDIAMLDSTAALLTYQAATFFATGVPPTRHGNRHPTIAPYDSFDVADGTIVLTIGNDEIWKRFCVAADLPDLAGDPRFATNAQRCENYAALEPILTATLRSRTRREWLARFNAAGVPCGSVRNIGEVLADPQLAARSMIENVDHATLGRISVIGTPVKLSETPGSIRTAPPTLGQHTDDILQRDLGLTDGDISRLRESRVI